MTDKEYIEKLLPGRMDYKHSYPSTIDADRAHNNLLDACYAILERALASGELVRGEEYEKLLKMANEFVKDAHGAWETSLSNHIEELYEKHFAQAEKIKGEK